MQDCVRAEGHEEVGNGDGHVVIGALFVASTLTACKR